MQIVDPRLRVYSHEEKGEYKSVKGRTPSIDEPRVRHSGRSWSISLGPRPFDMLAATAAVCAAIVAAYFLRSWERLRIVGLTTLTGVAYSMVHNRLGNRTEYYTGSSLLHSIGHPFWQQTSLVFRVYALAGTVVAVLSRASIPGLVLKITAVQLAPCFAI